MNNTTQQQTGNELSMAEAKALANKSPQEAAGKRFIAQTGAIGVILAELSPRGKPQAELTCLTPGCTETHIREISDWHQCGMCRTHKKSKSRSGGGSSTGSVSAGGLRLMKVLPTDDAETVALKEENNRIVTQLMEKEKEEREAKKAQDAEARKAKQEQDKAKRELEKAQKQKEAIAANLNRIKEEAAKRGLPVSPRTLAEAGEG